MDEGFRSWTVRRRVILGQLKEHLTALQLLGLHCAYLKRMQMRLH